jgi:hypothetical protein
MNGAHAPFPESSNDLGPTQFVRAMTGETGIVKLRMLEMPPCADLAGAR